MHLPFGLGKKKKAIAAFLKRGYRKFNKKKKGYSRVFKMLSHTETSDL